MSETEVLAPPAPVASAPAPAASPLTAFRAEKQSSFRALFGESFPDTPVKHWEPAPYTPEADPNYHFRQELVLPAMLWIGGIKKNLYLSGPTSAGKSSFIEQLAARLGLEVFRMPCHRDVEMLDFTGGMELTQSGTEYIAGALIMAMERGGILLIDEKDLLNPSVAAALHTVLDGKPLYVPQAKRWIAPHRMFRIAATGNSAGLGDPTKLYKGVNRMNVATIRRYLHVKVDYMSADEETALLKRVLPKLSDTAREIMLRVANMTRQAFVGGLHEVSGEEQLDVVISTDTLITWGKIVLVYEKSPAMKGKDLLAESLHPALLNCLLDRDNVNKAHAILGFLERVKGDLGKAGAP